ncbi:MAG: HlyC/CorC family transporter [Proteobacteria bacterium]|nr:HlyC/CorC family transporter [Pseudomonadota bacterium]
MSEGLLWGIFVIFVCLALSAFFSATETALTSLSSLKAKHLRENHGRAGKALDLWLNSPHRVLAAVLIGNNLVNIFASIYADNLLSKTLGQTSVEVVTAVMTVTIVLFSEIIPKTLAKTYATQIALPMIHIFRVFYLVLLPFTWLLSSISDLVSHSVRKRNIKTAPQITEEELEFLIDVGEEEGVLAEQKHEMLSGIFELGDTVVREVMVHRTDMTALPMTSTVHDAAEIFRERGLSRIPVFDGRVDNIIGILHLKDILFFVKKHARDESYWEAPIADIKRDAIFVPESKPVDQLFQEMRKSRQHMAIVLDEYGGTSGVVTMEDILEEIVGEIRDEFDNEEDAIRPTQLPNQYLIECKIHIDDFCDFFDLRRGEIIEDEQSAEFDTLGGFILHHIGQIPRIGDRLTIGRVVVEVLEVSRRRVRRVVASINASETSAGENQVPQNPLDQPAAPVT